MARVAKSVVASGMGLSCYRGWLTPSSDSPWWRSRSARPYSRSTDGRGNQLRADLHRLDPGARNRALRLQRRRRAAASPSATRKSTICRKSDAGFQWVGIAHLKVVETERRRDGTAGFASRGNVEGQRAHPRRPIQWAQQKPSLPAYGLGQPKAEAMSSRGRDQPPARPSTTASSSPISAIRFLSVSETQGQGIESGPGDWRKVWIDLPTTDGQILSRGAAGQRQCPTYHGDGRLGVILGGVQANPHRLEAQFTGICIAACSCRLTGPRPLGRP